jgi:hypothetical protein
MGKQEFLSLMDSFAVNEPADIWRQYTRQTRAATVIHMNCEPTVQCGTLDNCEALLPLLVKLDPVTLNKTQT